MPRTPEDLTSIILALQGGLSMPLYRDDEVLDELLQVQDSFTMAEGTIVDGTRGPKYYFAPYSPTSQEGKISYSKFTMAGARPIGGTKVVTAAGTAEQLVTTRRKWAYSLTLQAKAGNSGNTYLGDSGVDKATSQQMILTPGASVTFEMPLSGFVLRMTDWWVDVDVSGEGVGFLYVEAYS